MTYDFLQGPLYWSAIATYDDDCFAMVATLDRNLTYMAGYNAGYTVSLRLVFKSLGEMPVKLFSSP
jgi:hypothetical protein